MQLSIMQIIQIRFQTMTIFFSCFLDRPYLSPNKPKKTITNEKEKTDWKLILVINEKVQNLKYFP